MSYASAVLPSRLALRIADQEDREAIYRLRHDVYAVELAQHPINAERRLIDAIDRDNCYITASRNGRVVGCISITPPIPGARFSIEKYVARSELPVGLDDGAFEVRLLTVDRRHRHSALAIMLMYAALRWVQERGGRHIIGMGRHEVMALYRRVGLRSAGRTIHSGSVSFELMFASVVELKNQLSRFERMLRRLERVVDWRLPIPLRARAACYHGGAFFEAIGDGLLELDQRKRIINADVLDAWFSPSPKVAEAMRGHFSWLMRTSPPTGCEGLIRAIADARGVDASCILPGAGSSDLIFRTLREWLTPQSRVLILDPAYGEYFHVAEHVVGCSVERFALSRANDFRIDVSALCDRIRKGRHDLVILVNPNSPTGQHVSREELESILKRIPPRTRIWIDETYIEYAGHDQSLEQFAARRDNVVICKSMSKVYALSGMRLAYLCGNPGLIEPLRAITPPWVIGLPSQLAGITALGDPQYYRHRYAQTHVLREKLASQLATRCGLEALPGIANFLLCHLPESGPNAAVIVAHCRKSGLFLRDASTMGRQLGPHAVRIAVKDAATNAKIVDILASALTDASATPPSTSAKA